VSDEGLRPEDEGGLVVKITLLDADGNELEADPPGVPPGCIGAVAEMPDASFPVELPDGDISIVDGNLGTYPTFELAVEALRSNHRQAWTREERRRASGGW
jgi:hypothetical protein